jgi:mannose-6-phosphate isomerase-like protein (cupin superfamily)
MEKEWETEKYEITKGNWGEMGKLKTGGNKRGWIFGSFREIKSLAKTNDFELKYWFFKKGEEALHEPKFQVLATEYNFIMRGKIKGRVGDKKDIILEAGDYIVIRPGEIVNLQQEIIEDVEGITIKAPSRHGDTIKKSIIGKLLNFEK